MDCLLRYFLMPLFIFENVMNSKLNNVLAAQLPNTPALQLAVTLLFSVINFSTWAAPVEEIKSESVSVTANPLGAESDKLVTPVAILNGHELSNKRESTLGETLNSIPGVTSSYFGPNASRPVIRGMDADRVRIMQNGIGVLDASSVSPDHAVSIDPLVIEQIDVVRGPATLLYGGGAVGGVVNAIDHRIPKDQLDGITGRSEIRFFGPDNQKSGAAVLDVGNGQFAVHADIYGRETDDLEIPGYAVSSLKAKADGTLLENRGKLINSDSKSNGGALGASLTFDNGYLGLSYANFNANYGTVAERGVRIDMKSDRWDFASEFKDLGNIISRAKIRFAYDNYQHVELADGVPGTSFKNKGYEGTLELGHAKIGLLDGVIGYQFHNSDFEALGDEAFVPKTQTSSQSLYLYEELPIESFKLSTGFRVESAMVDSAGGTKFGRANSRHFTPVNGSIGVLYDFKNNWSVTSNYNYTERAPSKNELFAHGPHLATKQYLTGDQQLDIERSNSLDAQVRWKLGVNSLNIGAFYTRFNNFVFDQNSGNLVDADGVAGNSGSTLLEAFTKQVPAIFKGFEAESSTRIYDTFGKLDLTLRGDYVRATNKNSGKPLPRIPPLRLGAGLRYQLENFGARFDILHAFKQNRHDDFELETDGYTDVSALLTYKLPTKLHLELFAKANNLLNEEIRYHTSYLKDISTAGERSLLVGLRAEY